MTRYTTPDDDTDSLMELREQAIKDVEAERGFYGGYAAALEDIADGNLPLEDADEQQEFVRDRFEEWRGDD